MLLFLHQIFEDRKYGVCFEIFVYLVIMFSFCPTGRENFFACQVHMWSYYLKIFLRLWKVKNVLKFLKISEISLKVFWTRSIENFALSYQKHLILTSVPIRKWKLPEVLVLPKWVCLYAPILSVHLYILINIYILKLLACKERDFSQKLK